MNAALITLVLCGAAAGIAAASGPLSRRIVGDHPTSRRLMFASLLLISFSFLTIGSIPVVSWLILVTATDGETCIQSMGRVPRFLGGLATASYCIALVGAAAGLIVDAFATRPWRARRG